MAEDVLCDGGSPQTAFRDAWVDGAERDLGEKRSKADSSRRVEAIQRRYGEQLAALCGQQEGRGTEELLGVRFLPFVPVAISLLIRLRAACRELGRKQQRPATA